MDDLHRFEDKEDLGDLKTMEVVTANALVTCGGKCKIKRSDVK